ncbi:nuclear autoantigen Sp-100 isoform X4 [Moschus berezovskii]|uniref:nuclear autoantigen Sp-100 isoform X4 n=1 Tax=Moschus berezovskii TaxID=68408 RepID=UPI002444ADD0|nr:nuclear autoantigen Sp-100 isoform X4 [Moschus berezovskii]
MAGEGRELSTRISTENQNTEDRLVFETVFRHFKRHKVEISTAIKKTFPFFEGLRDRELITNKMYEDCQDSCRNLVPVPRVVYNVLSELEKTFNQSLLEALFSDVNMQEYPDLNHVRKGFENAIQEKLSYEEIDGEEREERPAIQLSLEQGTSGGLTWSGGESSSYDGSDLGASMSCLAETSATTRAVEEAGTASPENRLSDHLSETEEINAKRNKTPSNQNDELESQQANEQCDHESEPAEFCEPAPIQSNNADAREETPDPLPSNKERAKPSNHGLQINSCSVRLVDIKKEKPFFNSEFQLQAQARTDYNQVSDIIVISSEDSAESSDGEELPEPSTSTPRRITDPSAIGSTSIFRTSSRKRRMSGGDSSDLSNEGEPQATSSSALRNGSDPTDIGSNSTLGKHGGKRRRKTVCTESLKRGRKRGPRVPRDPNMDFQRDQLPVTCGEAMGTLYKEKMRKGTSEKCIKDKNGKWFTLKEFEDEGDHKASKNWKQSVRCGGWPLKILIQNGSLPDPSRKRKKSRMSGSDCKSSSDVAGMAKKLQELEAQRKDEERREEEVTAELKRFTRQEMARGFSLSEEAALVSEAQDSDIERYMKVVAAVQNAVRCYRVFHDEKNRATTQTSLDHFLKRVDRIESSEELEPVSSMAGVSEIAARPPSPIAADPSALPSSTSWPYSGQ